VQKRLLTLLTLLLFAVNISTPSIAATDVITDQTSKIINKLGIETAVKGKKLKEFFSGNTLRLLIDEKTKEYKFQEKTYEVFEDGKSIESGKWKVSGLLKNQIKLNADDSSKAYYLKKINKKALIYRYDKLPGSENDNKKSLEIIDDKNEEIINVKKDTELNKDNSKKKSKKSSSKIDNILKTGISNILGTEKVSPKNSVKQNNGNKIEKHMLERYRATSDISFFFFEASLNYLQALELLYRAYDNNIEADKINASISYLKESKSSEADRLNSTKSIIGTSTIKLQSNLQDTSYILSEKGRGYYEQSLPFVVGATESTIYLYNSSRGALQKFSQLGGLSIDSLLSNSNDLVAAASIIPEIPQFSRDLIKTAKLVLNGAKEKKIRNEGKYSKALDQLNLLEFDNEMQDKKKSKVEEPKVEEPRVVKKKEETKVVKKKEEPKVEEPRVVKKKEEPKVEEPKVVKKKTKKISKRVKNKDKIKTKEDLEAFLIGTELETSGVYDGKTYITKKKFDYDGIFYVYSSGQKTKMVWEAINGNTFKTAQAGYEDYLGWNTYVLDYDNLTFTNTSEKTFEGNELLDKASIYKGEILSPKIFVKKEVKEKKVVAEIPEGQIVQILAMNCSGSERIKPIKPETGNHSDGTWKPAEYDFSKEIVGVSTTFEIDFENGNIYTTTAEGYGSKENRRFKIKNKILSYDEAKITAIGSPYLAEKDIGEYEIEYNFYYQNKYKKKYKGIKDVRQGDLVGKVGGEVYEMQYQCYPETYLADKSNVEKTLKTYSNSDGYPLPFDFEKANKYIDVESKKDQARREMETDKLMAELNKQISSEYKDTMKSLKMKSNKYGSSQLEQTKKIVNNVSKEDFKTYNVTSLISYYFFDSMSNYLESLEFLYRAYDKNTDADKLKAQIAYLKSSKGSEKERLESTKQIINSASLEVQADVQDESIVLSDEAKINYQKALPFAFKATDSGYKLFVVSKGLVTEIKGSGNLLGTLLKNANELKGAATVVPLIPDYIKKVGGTAKLIFSGAKTKKIKDKENLSTALDELDLSA